MYLFYIIDENIQN